MIPEYYQGLKPVMKDLVLALGVRLVRIPYFYQVYANHVLGSHDRGDIWVSMDPNEWGGPEAILLHEIAHWTGGWGRLERPEIIDYEGGMIPLPEDLKWHEEAVAQYTMMLLAPALGILTEKEARHLFYKYVTWAYDVPKVTESAYKAFGYVRMLAPHLFGRKSVAPVCGLVGADPYVEAA